MSHADVPKIMASLPTEAGCPPYLLRQYEGFWCTDLLLNGIAGAQACFTPRPTDIFLASIPKSGTTWLKALAFATLNRAAHSPLADDHPLRHSNPHDCVGFLEVKFMLAAAAREDDDDARRDMLAELPSPRLLATHAPYSLLLPCITGEGSAGCRFVYICRDPNDVLVSFSEYNERTAATLQKVGGIEAPAPTFKQAFELFCEGRSVCGPQWRHALEFWKESKKRPEKVLFLRYEEMLQDPIGNARKLASFMGCPFSAEEEEAGVVREIVELCSFGSLKNSEVNKSGSTMLGIKNDVFFRKGEAGDWKNHMTPEMAARLDKVVEEALRGSGLTFTNSV